MSSRMARLPLIHGTLVISPRAWMKFSDPLNVEVKKCTRRLSFTQALDTILEIS